MMMVCVPALMATRELAVRSRCYLFRP